MPSQRNSAVNATWAHGSRSGCYGSGASLPVAAEPPRSRSTSHEDEPARGTLQQSVRPSSRGTVGQRGSVRPEAQGESPDFGRQSQRQPSTRHAAEPAREQEGERRSMGRSLASQGGRGASQSQSLRQPSARHHSEEESERASPGPSPQARDSRLSAQPRGQGSLQSVGGAARHETARSGRQTQSRDVEEEHTYQDFPDERPMGSLRPSSRGTVGGGSSLAKQSLRQGSMRQAEGSMPRRESLEREQEGERRSMGRSSMPRQESLEREQEGGRGASLGRSLNGGRSASTLGGQRGSQAGPVAGQRSTLPGRSVCHGTQTGGRAGSEEGRGGSADARSEVTEMTDHDRASGEWGSPQSFRATAGGCSTRDLGEVDGSPVLLGARSPSSGDCRKPSARCSDAKGRAAPGSRREEPPCATDSFTEEQTEGGTWRARGAAKIKCVVLDKRDVAGVKALVWKFGSAGAWIRRVAPEAPPDLGLDRGDKLLAVNGYKVADGTRSAIEAAWSQAQKEGRYLHLELAPAEPGCRSPWEN